MGKIIGLVVVGVLIIGGLMYWGSRESNPAMNAESTHETGETVDMDAKPNVISSIQDAMGLGQKMQCTYTMGETGKSIESTVVVDGKKFKSTTKIDNMTVYGVFDGENQYSWTSASTTGMKMSKACLEKFADQAKSATTTPDTGAKVEDLSSDFDLAKNVTCEPVGAADFTLPATITFTDQCALLEQSAKLLEDMKGKLPPGMNLPGVPTN